MTGRGQQQQVIRRDINLEGQAGSAGFRSDNVPDWSELNLICNKKKKKMTAVGSGKLTGFLTPAFCKSAFRRDPCVGCQDVLSRTPDRWADATPRHGLHWEPSAEGDSDSLV